MIRKSSTGTNPIDNLITEYLHPLLAPLGFNRRGRTWNRKIDNLVQVINVQGAKSNIKESYDFTINIGVCSLRVFQAVWQKPSSSFVKETDCTMRLRIGDLQEGGVPAALKDIWWNIDNTRSLDEIGESVVAALKSRVIPFLDRVQSDESILEMMGRISGWQSKFVLNQIYLAALSAEVGQTANAVQLLDGASRSQAWQERALAVKRFYHLG